MEYLTLSDAMWPTHWYHLHCSGGIEDGDEAHGQHVELEPCT